MANPVRFFFYMPTWDYPPGGPVKLGSVIASVKTPEQALYSDSPPGVYTTTKTCVEYTKDSLNCGRFSILTKFLSILGFGVDVGAEVSTSNEEKYSFDTIETSQFELTNPYIQHCLKAEGVRRYLKLSRYRKPIYIITGLKTVSGARARTRISQSIAGDISLDLDGTVWSGGTVPIGGGPAVEARVVQSTGTSWQGTSDFVFAFRVARVFVSKKTGDIVRLEDYKKGAMLGLDDRWDDRVPELYVESIDEGEDDGEGLEGWRCLITPAI